MNADTRLIKWNEAQQESTERAREPISKMRTPELKLDG